MLLSDSSGRHLCLSGCFLTRLYRAAAGLSWNLRFTPARNAAGVSSSGAHTKTMVHSRAGCGRMRALRMKNGAGVTCSGHENKKADVTKIRYIRLIWQTYRSWIQCTMPCRRDVFFAEFALMHWDKKGRNPARSPKRFSGFLGNWRLFFPSTPDAYPAGYTGNVQTDRQGLRSVLYSVYRYKTG